MKKITVFLLIFVGILLTRISLYAMQMDGCGAGECKDCHSLSQEEAELIFKRLVNEAIKVINVEKSPVPGLWQVNIESQGKVGPVYVDFSKQFVIEGRIYNVANEKKFSRLNIAFSEIPISNDIVLGNPEAVKKVVVFDDPDCPYCAKLHAEIKKVIKKRNDIAFYIKLFPLKFHPKAYMKSKAIACSKSTELLNMAFAGEPLPEPTCETTQIDENIEFGKKIGIRFIPAIILQDGRVYPGYKDADTMIQLIDSVSTGS